MGVQVLWNQTLLLKLLMISTLYSLPLLFMPLHALLIQNRIHTYKHFSQLITCVK